MGGTRMGFSIGRVLSKRAYRLEEAEIELCYKRVEGCRPQEMSSHATEMELDNNPLLLKRSSSAPMINDINPSPPQTPLIRYHPFTFKTNLTKHIFNPIN
jgi:hypothetical protein